MVESMWIKTFLLRSLTAIGSPGLQQWTQGQGVPSERYPTTEEFLQDHAGGCLAKPLAHSLDLGCGPSPRNPFGAKVAKGVDIRASEDLNIVGCDLGASPILFVNECFNYVTVFDFIEHIPRVAIVDGKIRPEGLFFSRTPAYPCSEAFQDSTHVNIITEGTFPLYFCGDSWLPTMASRALLS
ncbi:MAG: hypothetical protein ACKO45_16195 [Cyanobium sp.]